MTKIEQRLSLLERKICSAKEVFSLNVALTGTVKGCYKFGINTTTGDLYFKNSIGEWQLIPQGSGSGSGSVLPIYADMNAAIVGGLTNNQQYRIPYNNGNFLVGVVITVPANALLNENGTPMLNEDGTYILI